MKSLVPTLLLLALSFGPSLSAQSLLFRLESDSSQIDLGESLTLRLEAELPAQSDYQWPAWPDSLDPLEVLEAGEIDTLSAAGASVLKLRQELRIIAFDSGYVRIPALRLSAGKQEAFSEALVLYIRYPELSDDLAYYDLKALESVPRNWWLVLAYALAAAAGLALLIWAIRLWVLRPKKSRAPQPEPALSPEAWALQALAQLEAQDFLPKGQIKSFYSELIDILRHYLEREYALKAMESTAEELSQALAELSLPEEHKRSLKSALQRSALVKFAKALPALGESETDFAAVEKLVRWRLAQKEQSQKPQNHA